MDDETGESTEEDDETDIETRESRLARPPLPLTRSTQVILPTFEIPFSFLYPRS